MILPSEDECIAKWAEMSPRALAELDPNGGFEKRHLLNPVVLRMLGDVVGKRVLDAGSCQGYFSRMLARRGTGWFPSSRPSHALRAAIGALRPKGPTDLLRRSSVLRGNQLELARRPLH
jgi:hypothetical protein